MNRAKLILWSRPKDIGIKSMAELVYNILRLLKNYGDEINPKYITSRNKTLAKELVLDKDVIKALLEKKVDKTGLRLFNQLTTRVSFFSSMDDEKSSGISIHIGNCDPRFNNTCVIHLPEGFSGLTEKRKEFVYLFKQLIETFEPYYGFVYCDNDNQTRKEFWLNSKPTYVHWINYYDLTTANAIGLKAVQSIDGAARLGDGYFFMLQDEPPDVNNPKHAQNQKELTELLDL